MKKNNIPLNFTEKNRSRISLITSIVTVFVLCIILTQIDKACTVSAQKAAVEAAAAAEQAEAEALAAQTKVSAANFIAVGDNLFHTKLYESGQDSTPWNYDHVYENVASYVQAADVAIVDQETVFTEDNDEVSSYPSFATPMEVGDALVAAGFDVFESATNHVDDFGTEMIEETMNFWKTKYPDKTVLGIHDSAEDAEQVKVVDANGIKVAFLNYCYGSNTNLTYTEGKEYMVDYLEREKVSAMIAKAKEVSDCIVFIVQWGTEDQHIPNEYQRQWAKFLLDQGVDVTIGGHPHAVQPFETMTNEKGDEMLIYYSLGNFTSTQNDISGLLGAMAKFTIEKTETPTETTVKVTNSALDPLIMHYNHDSGIYTTYMLSDYTEELAAQHSARDNYGEEFSKANLEKLFDRIMAIKVAPSTRTEFLDVVKWNPDGSVEMADGTILYEEEIANMNIPSNEDPSVERFKNGEDMTDDNSDDSYDDGSYDDDSYNDGSYDDESYDDGSYDDESYDDGSYDDESYDDGSYDDESYDDGSYDDESYDDGSYDDESYDDGSYDDGSYNDEYN